jgi:hypothetical protein
MDSSGSAFVKGGLGCIGAFLVIGLLVLLLGGHVHLDLGGVCMLFVIGGVIGLVGFAIYKKGYTEGRAAEAPPPDEDGHPER